MNPRARTSVVKDILKGTPSATVVKEEPKEPVQQITEETEQESSSGYDSVSADNMSLDVHRPNKGAKPAHKARGSILARMNEGVTLPSHSRTRNAVVSKGKEKEKKAKRQELKHKNLDIYIPSVISVGNLARLLNVRLGMSPCSRCG